MSIVEQLSGDLAQDVQRHRLQGKGVTLKYKTTAFDVKTRIIQLPGHTDDASVIARAAKKILAAEMESNKSLELRLLGVRMSHFHACQEPAVKKQRTLSQLFDECPAPAPKKVKTEFTCPVCNAWKTTDSEVELNRHLDECLNRQLLPAGSAAQPARGQSKLDRFLVAERKSGNFFKS